LDRSVQVRVFLPEFAGRAGEVIGPAFESPSRNHGAVPFNFTGKIPNVRGRIRRHQERFSKFGNLSPALDFVKAIRPFESAVKQSPDSYQARYLLGLCYFFNDRWADAVAMLAGAAGTTIAGSSDGTRPVDGASREPPIANARSAG